MDIDSEALRRYLNTRQGGDAVLRQLEGFSEKEDSSLIEAFHNHYSAHQQYKKILEGMENQKWILENDNVGEGRTIAGEPKLDDIANEDAKRTATSKNRISGEARTIQEEDAKNTIASKPRITKDNSQDAKKTMASRKPQNSLTGQKTGIANEIPIPKTQEDEVPTIVYDKIKKAVDEDATATIAGQGNNHIAGENEDETATIHSRAEKPEQDNKETIQSQPKKPARSSVQRKLDNELGNIFAEPKEKTAKIKNPLEEFYEIGNKIGKGGMGEVISGTQKNLERIVALKKLTHKFDPELIQRFLLEAKITAQLDHPAIPPVHDLFSEQLTFSMKYVDGETLSSIVEKLKSKKSTHTLNETLRLFIKACEGVAYAHAKGVIHRDLKPENIMIGKFGEVYVMDWGLAKVKGKPDITGHSVIPQKDDGKLTMSGTIMGTPLYMAPEQAAGELEQIDSLSDQYSLGATLYELITLDEAISTSGTAENILYRVMKGQIKEINKIKGTQKKVPKELKSIILKSMSKDKADRYDSITDFMADIQNYLDGNMVNAHHYSLIEKTARIYKKHSKKLLTGLAGLVVLAAGSTAVLHFQSQAEKAEIGKAKAEAKAAKEKEKTAEAKAEAEKEKAKTLEAKAEAAQSDLRAAKTEAESERKAKNAEIEARERRNKSTKLTEEGYAFYERKVLTRALSKYNEAIKEDPENPFPFHNRALVFRDQKNMLQALEDLSKSVELSEKNTAYRSQYAYQLELMGRKNESTEQYRKGAEQYWEEGGNPIIVLNLANHLGRIEEREESIEVYNQFLKEVPSDYSVYASIAHQYAKLNKFEEARKNANIALEKGFTGAYFELGEIEYYQQNWAKTIEFLEKAKPYRPEKAKNINEIITYCQEQIKKSK